VTPADVTLHTKPSDRSVFFSARVDRVTTRTTDGRLVRGERTRLAVLDAALLLATERGLDGLSLGQLAESLGVSKSGLFAHWRSKEDLQLATVDRAREQWIDEIVRPALAAPRGVRRLWALHERRLTFYEPDTVAANCFFSTTKFEYRDRPGPVRDRLAAALSEWLGLLEGVAAQAVAIGDLVPSVDPAHLAFEIDALGDATVLQARLLDRAAVHHLARAAVLGRLRGLCTDPSLLPEA
jgi:AcrR family transcriptional regulator